MGSEKYGDTCRLIAVNLYEFVDHPFESNSTFNLTKFKDVIYKAQRLSDDLVDLEIEYIDRIIEKIIQDPEPNYVKEPGIRLWENLKESAKKGRRTGLGFTALADTLAALGLKYDSEEALSITERIMRAKCEAEFNSSVDLAIERGAFPAYDSEIEKESLFIQMLQKEFPELYDKMKEHGRRNISLSTVAPTGSVSILTQTSSGIEPVFMLKYTRRRKITDKENADFVDESGDAWQEYEVIHPKLKKWMEVTGNGNVEESPYNKSKANDIDWKKRIELQAVVQLFTSHSISMTLNVSEDTTKETVSDIYFYAWMKGLKGATVYRQGSRSGVLIESKELVQNRNGSKIIKADAPKRPTSLPCNIHHLQADYHKWIVIVGMLNEDPYEVFAFKEKDVKLPRSVIQGTLTKVERGKYNLVTRNKTYEHISNLFESAEQEALTRMISTALRHGSDISFIVSQLMKSQGTIFSFSKAIARTLNKYVKEVKGFQCSDCGSSNIKLEEGCMTCLDCGSSKCS